MPLNRRICEKCAAARHAAPRGAQFVWMTATPVHGGAATMLPHAAGLTDMVAASEPRGYCAALVQHVCYAAALRQG